MQAGLFSKADPGLCLYPVRNAYNLFCSEMLKQMGHMGSNTRAKMMECSALWSDTDAEKKKEYKERVEQVGVINARQKRLNP